MNLKTTNWLSHEPTTRGLWGCAGAIGCAPAGAAYTLAQCVGYNQPVSTAQHSTAQHPRPAVRRKRRGPWRSASYARVSASAVIGSNWSSVPLKSVYGRKSRHLHRKQHRNLFLQFFAGSRSLTPAYREGDTGNPHRKSNAPLAFTPPLGG